MIIINKSKSFDSTELQLFTHIINFNQKRLISFLQKYLEKHYSEVIATDKYLVAIGNIPVGLVAHMDTVHADLKTKKELFYDKIQNVIWSPDGLGADDRAGVYAIIDIISAGYHPTIIFTTDEEIGALGARQMIKDYPDPIAELKYLIELDRRGSTDCVFYDCDNKEFTKYVESFGFISQWGSFSDISEICPAWKIAGVNLSIGYDNEHTKAEYLRVSWMRSTINKVIKMLDDIQNAKSYEYIHCSNYSWYDDDYAYYYGYDSFRFRCHKCQELFGSSDVVRVKTKYGSTVYYCVDCLDGGIGWCDVCEEIYELDETHQAGDNLCPTCKKRVEKEREKDGNSNNTKAI